jgi:hypothetical protein
LSPRGHGEIPFANTIKAAKVLDGALGDSEMLSESPADFPAGEVEMLSYPGADYMVPWGDMTILRPPLHARFGAKVSPRHRATDVGMRLRNVSRVLTDGRIFSHRVKQAGGALLLDGSGSMSMHPSDVREILSIAPMAWVGIYGAGTRRGALKILAEKGKGAHPDQMRSPGGCNVVDGPALEVLAQQSAPRIWICDGHVTGIGDASGVGNVVECARICTRANIKRIDTIEEAIAYLRMLGKPR